MKLLTRNSFYKLLFTWVILYTSILAHPVYGQGLSKQNLVVKLRWKHTFQFAGLYAAQMKGFYKAKGLSVELQESDIGDGPINAVLTSAADFGVAGTDLITSRSLGKPVVVIAAFLQHSPYIIISEKSKNIKTPYDLVGKKVMIAEELGAVQLKSLLKKLEIPLDNIQFVPHTWNKEDVFNGYADAMSGHYSTDPHSFRHRNKEINMIRPINYGVDFYGDMLFCTQDKIDNDPDQVESFVEASLQGWEYALGHIEEVAAYILTLPGVKERGIGLDDLMEEAVSIQRLVKSEVVPIGDVNVDKLNIMMNAHYEFGIITKRFNVNSFIYQSKKKIASSSPYILLSYFFAAVFVVSVLVVIWNSQLREEIKQKNRLLEEEIDYRKKLEYNTKNSEERLELALSAARLGIWDSDLVIGTVYRNTLWAEMLGYNPDEIANSFDGWRNLVHPEDWPMVERQIEMHRSGLQLYNSYEHRLKAKNGQWKWILNLSKIVSSGADGKPLRVIGIHFDIDEIKNKEIQLQKIAEELMYTNAELEKFAYITSHNLRAPVVNLISLIEMLQLDKIKDELTVAVIEKVQMSVKRLEQTLNDLIEIVSAKKLTLSEKRLIFFENITNTVLANLETQIDESKAEILTDFTEVQTAYYVKAVLESILQNLLSNSIKYRSPLRPLQIEIFSKQDAKFVYLHVKDNGQGFDKEQFGEKIFKLYERLDYSIEGKGLGLYLIKTQVEALSGKIEVCSKPDKGATFIISIPKNNVS